MTITHDGPINIAVGESRRSISWQNKELLWSDLVKRLHQPTRTPETEGEYFASSKAKRDEIKDVGGFVGGVLKGGRRKADTIENRRLITLDMDNIPKGSDPWEAVDLVLGCGAVMYSTHSHQKNAPRLRLILPLSRPVNPDEYAAVSRRIGGDIGIDMCDDTTFEPHRLMYWPSLPRDGEYRLEVQDGKWLDVDEQLARYTDWTDPAQWPVSSRKDAALKKLAKHQGDPDTKPGIIGAFNRVYAMEDAINEFLFDVYAPVGEGRYSFKGGSTTGGLVLYEKGKFAYSHHGTDPVSGKLCSAFDLVRIHLFGDLDDVSNPGVPMNRLPSFIAMQQLATQDAQVREDVQKERLREVCAAFDEGEDTQWLQNLTVSPKGQVEATIDNALTIMLHDPQLKGNYYYDVFRGRPVVAGDMPWQAFDKRSTDRWVDSDDAGLRLLIEKKYGISSAFKVQDAVDLAMVQNTIHPVREYLESLKWDGVKRAETLFIDYLGAGDNSYIRQVTRKGLLGAVARIYQPGCKHDHMPVLVGPQGTFKSTTLAKLGKKWFSDSLYTMSGKEAYEQVQGCWIIELSEMAATKKSEVEQTKQFISKQRDIYRAAYARRPQEHPRQCAFFGTTNDDEFLRDPTGARRFWPIEVTKKARETGPLLTDETVDQIWAEMVVAYKAGEVWYLDVETEKAAMEQQKRHTETSSLTGLIEQFIAVKLPKGWDEYTLDQRLMFLDNSGFETERVEGTQERTRICAIEVWCEMLGNNMGRFSQREAREINNALRQLEGWEGIASTRCGKPYGKQRAFAKVKKE